MIRSSPIPAASFLLLVATACGEPAMQTWLEPLPGAPCTWRRAEGLHFNDLLPPEGAPRNARGTLLRLQELPRTTALELGLLADRGRPAPHGARVFRLLYLSQAPADVPRVVSARLALPDVAMADDAVLVVRGHGTTGMSDNSAPMFEPGFGFQQPGNPYTAELVARGHAVIQTDYAGLGTHGTHPYMILEAHAFGVIDSIRAARRLCDGTATLPGNLPRRVVMEGHSQGGHAILGALQSMAAGDDPGVDVLGAVLFAPGAEPAEIAVTAASSENSRLVTPVAMSLVAYADQHPGAVNLEDVFVPERMRFVDLVHRLPAPALAPYTTDTPSMMFKASFLEAVRTRNSNDPVIAALRPIQEANTPGNFHSSVPMLLVHGTADDLISVDVTDRLNRRLCERGNIVRRVEVDGASHGGILRAGLQPALAWTQDRIMRRPETGDCATR